MTFYKSADPKTARLEIRFTAADKQQVEAAAREANLSVSDYMSRKALSRKVTPQSDQHLINAMRESIAALREMYFSGTPVTDERLRPALDAVANAMHRVIGRKKRDS
jgi:uncharacterized protein (DUF1778 family)